MIKAYKYRIYPNEDQKQSIEKHFGCCRLVWNLALAAKIHAYQSNRIVLSKADLEAQLVDLKHEYEWLYDTNSQSLQSVLRHLESAYKKFFSGYGFPKFKGKHGQKSFQCPQRVRLLDCKLFLPNVGDVDIALSRKFTGKIKTVTVSKTSTGKYFASILAETEALRPTRKEVVNKTTIGLDVGIKSFVATSDGKLFEPNRKLKDSLQRLKCLQRRASRKKKGSNNRKKANLCVAILHEKITNQRTDYIHKITTQLIRDNQTESFVIEDLNVAGMLKNRKLSRAISDVSFGEFFWQLKYKCDWYGKNLITIGRFEPSSKMCSDCGAINQELTLADREWTCECGATHDRDLNAAINIRNIGLEKYSRRGTPGEPVESSAIVEAMKQEQFKN